jgi:diguanylate cyclase (GGDEF)-like protein
VLGVLAPNEVFNHPAAQQSPFKWALIHGGFVLAASVAYLVNWRLSERQAVEISRLVSRLEGLARTDPLTGVPNRRVWEEELPRELERARRMGTGVCVAMIDLDDFNAYNDRFGHQAGDLVLKEAASAWRAEVRSTDLLARYGGEEFVLLLPACALEDAVRIVERLRLVTPLVTCSVGLGPRPGQPGPHPATPEPDPPVPGPSVGERSPPEPADAPGCPHPGEGGCAGVSTPPERAGAPGCPQPHRLTLWGWARINAGSARQQEAADGDHPPDHHDHRRGRGWRSGAAAVPLG